MPGFRECLFLGVLWALATTLLLRPPATFAQIDDGQVVQTPDGALWVVDGGQLHPVTPLYLEYADLLGVPVGPAATNGVMLRPSPAAAAPPSPEAPAASTTQAPPPPSPGPGMVSATTRVVVVDVQRPHASNRNPSAGEEFVLIRVRYENLGDTRAELGNRSNFRVQVPNGSVREPLSEFAYTIPDPLKSVSVFPGTANEGNLMFSIPRGQPIKVLYQSNTLPNPIELPMP